MSLTVGSLFAGVGGFDLGLERAGMTPAWQVELDGRCRQVLAYHWPAVERHADVEEVTGDRLPAVDVLCGGFPCTDISVAGRRAGLDGDQSRLWWEFHRLIHELAPLWVLVENTPGLLSSNDGADMGAVIGALADLGYGYAWRVLDAQHFGLAQRRRRLFIVGRAGADGAGAAQVLLEPESGGRRAPPGGETFTDVAGTLGAGTAGGGWADDLDRSGGFVPEVWGLSTQGEGGSGVWQRELAPTVTGSHGDGMVAYPLVSSHQTLDHTKETLVFQANLGVRRFLPVERERLQGFPDDWTRWGADGTEMSDTARERMCGNAVPVSVVEWLGRRIPQRLEQTA